MATQGGNGIEIVAYASFCNTIFTGQSSESLYTAVPKHCVFQCNTVELKTRDDGEDFCSFSLPPSDSMNSTLALATMACSHRLHKRGPGMHLQTQLALCQSALLPKCPALLHI